MANYYNEKVLAKFHDALRMATEEVRSGKVSEVSISGKNSKMGEVASVSTLPYLTCPARCKGTCAGECYAAKIANLRKSVLISYSRNTALAILKPDLYWQGIRYAMAGRRFFRFHVSGDIMNEQYFAEMVESCRQNPHCQVLAFTKRFEIVNAWISENGSLPENMHLLFSGWDNMRPVNPYHLPETTVYGKDEEPAEEWLLCGGCCHECGCRGTGCWKAQTGETIAFRKH